MAEWWTVGAAAGLYALGTAAHELTHLLLCWLTGSRVKYVQAAPLEVGFEAPTPGVDALVRASTTAVSVPLVVGWVIWLLGDPWSYRWLGAAAVVGYVPRSWTDWQPVVRGIGKRLLLRSRHLMK